MSLINWAVFTLLLGVAVFASESGIHDVGNELPCDDRRQFLSVDKFCDGKRDCSDGSDETAKNCIHMHCPSYAFRCTYGGCIKGTGKCDGIPDCADGSDESLYMCYVDGEELEKQLSGNCTEPFDFQCSSGKCISAYKRCDGAVDCPDGSDELVSHCGHLYCPSYAFRCGYGACVRGSARCDGIQDCQDGSDETALLCRIPPSIPYVPMVPQPSSTEATTTTTTTTTTARSPTRRGGCQIPFRVKKLQVTNLIGDNNYKLGDYVEANNTKVLFECKDNWQLVGSPVSTCTTEATWTNPVPRCSKHCSNVLANKGISTDVKCFFYQNQVNCGNLLPTGASIVVTCAEGYEPKTRRSNKNQLLQCNEQVEWSNRKLKCTPTCGLANIYDDDQPLGHRAPTRVKRQPWDVSVFMRTFDKTFKRQCSGAIVSPKMIITAANCLKQEDDYSSITAYYNVVEGYYANDYIQGSNIGSTMHNISRIIISSREDVNGVPLKTHYDVALLVVVNYFEFNKMLSPICLGPQRQNDYIAGTLDGDDEAAESDEMPYEETKAAIAYPAVERPVELGDVQMKPRYSGSRAFYLHKMAVAHDARTGEIIFLDIAPFKKYFIKKQINFYNVLL